MVLTKMKIIITKPFIYKSLLVFLCDKRDFCQVEDLLALQSRLYCIAGADMVSYSFKSGKFI